MLKQSLYTEEAGPASVLVVDDEPFNIDLLCQELEEMGHNPVPAADGEAAMDMLAAKEVDLVLLDIMMPRMNGLQVLEALKEDGRLPNLPVIVVSAIDDIKSVARCIRLGAEDHLVKPFDPALLRARVEGALEKKRLRDKVARQLEVTRALFGRYVPPGVAEHVLSGDGELVPVLREASVLFSDLVGFTAIAQRMTPAEVMDLLRSAASEIPDVLDDPRPFVTVKEFAAQHIEYEVFFWLDVNKSERGFIDTRNDVKVSCWQALRDTGMTFSTDVSAGLDIRSAPALEIAVSDLNP